MADDIRVRFSADASSYNKQIKDLVQQNKTLKSETDKVKSSIDKNATAEEKAAKIAASLSKQVEAQKEYIKGLKAQYEKLTTEQGENSAAAMKQEELINKAKTALNSMNKELEEAEKAADGYGEEAVDAAEQTDEMAKAAKMLAASKLAEIFNKIGDAMIKVGKGALDAAKELDKGYDTIAKKTGATGKALDDLKKSADNVFGKLPAEMEDVGTAIGEVNTRFGKTGKELEKMSSTFLKFARITDVDVNNAIGTSSRLFKTFNVDAKNTENVLGYLAAQSQKTGVDTTTLMNALDQSGPVLRAMGLDLQESTRLLAMFEANGVDSTAAMTGLRKAIATGAKEGKTFDDVMREALSGIKNASTETEALAKATELFGTRGAVVMADGIRSGRISLDELTESIDKYGTVVEDTFEATLSPWDKTKVAMNNLKTAGSELLADALNTIAPVIEKIVDGLQGFVKWVQRLPGPLKVGVTALGGMAAVAPKILALFNTIKTFTAAKAISDMAKLSGATKDAANSAGNLSTKLGGLKTAGVTAGLIAAIGALNKAGKEYHQTGNDMYQTSKKNVEVFREMSKTGEQLMSVADAQERLAEIAKQTGMTVDELRNSVSEFNPTINDLGEIFNTFDAGGFQMWANTANEELAGLFDVIDNGSDAVDEYSDAVDDATESSEEMADASGDMADAVDDAAEEVTESFADIYKAAKDDLMASLSLVDKWADGSEQSMEDIVKTMADNQKAWDNWSDNVKYLTGTTQYKTDANFRKMVDSIISLEQKGAKGLQDVVTAHKNGSKDIINSWTQTVVGANASKENYATTMADFKAKTQLGMTGITESTKKGKQDILAEFDAIPRNIKAKGGEAKAAADEYAKGIGDGENGRVQYVKTAAGNVKKAAESAKPSTAGANAAGQAVPDAIAAGMSTRLWNVRSSASNIKLAAQEGVKPDQATILKYGEYYSEGMAEGIKRKAYLVNAAASDVSSIAIKAASKIAQIKSPSRVFMRLGEYMVEGMAIGLKKTEPIFDAIQDMQHDLLMPGLERNMQTILDVQATNQVAMDYSALGAAVANAVQGIDTKLIIGEREFGRVLREAAYA